MKILIVDDNSANRMTLKWVLSKIGILLIEEADSGQAAILACEKEKFDLIFMDVMMPGMTGIEATKEIKKILPNSMVIAITALDDEETTREMFNAGAEDYITKPIKQDIFKARLQTYFKVIENRNFYSLSLKSISLFNEPIFNRFTVFKIKRESNLAEFWEYYLYGGNGFGNEQLCDTISKIYNIGVLLLKMDARFSIFCEENEKTLFFTLNKTSILNKAVITDIIKKDGFRGSYLIADEKISFSVEKTQLRENESKKIAVIDQPQDKLSEPAKSTSDAFIEECIAKPSCVISDTSKDEIFVYNFMDEQDFIDIEEYIRDLDSMLTLMQSSKLEVGDVENIAFKIEKIASILEIYQETYELGTALRSLSFDIKDNINSFLGNKDMLSTIFFSFTRDLLDWFAKLFKIGAPSINFMDATIIANAVMISTTIKPQEAAASSGDLDDIFF